MIPYDAYKIIHVVGAVLVFMSLGGAIASALAGAGRAPAARRWLTITHGAALLVVIVAGFGLAARLGIAWPYPGWLWGKIVVWLVTGALLTVALRRASLARALWLVTPLLALAATWLAIAKP